MGCTHVGWKSVKGSCGGGVIRSKVWYQKATNFLLLWVRLAGLSLALVHKHVKMSVGKWIMETTRPHKHVQIPPNQFFLPSNDHFTIIFYLILMNILQLVAADIDTQSI